MARDPIRSGPRTSVRVVERDWLQSELESGRSIEAIARGVGRPSSTVAYWVKKYGLASSHAPTHAARGGVEAPELRAMVERDLTVREIAAQLGRSYTTIRYWLRRHGLQTTPAARSRRPSGVERTVGRCERHGEAEFVRTRDGLRCARCRAEGVTEWRRKAKRILVAEAGGCCAICGYSRCIAALQFHHRDPAAKRFGLGSRGLAQALDRLREEASKCVLLCSNCHAEVEAGYAQLPLPLADKRSEGMPVPARA